MTKLIDSDMYQEWTTSGFQK